MALRRSDGTEAWLLSQILLVFFLQLVEAEPPVAAVESALHQDLSEEAFVRPAGRRLQDFGPPIPRSVWHRVGILNDSPVPGYWIVYELQLFYDLECKDRVPFDFGTVWHTGTHRETEFTTTGNQGMDGSTDTWWEADCRLVLGGCGAFTVGLGIDISRTKPFAAARLNADYAWNVTRPYFEAITVKCIRIFQSEDVRYKTDRIAVVTGTPDPADPRIYTYNAVTVFQSVAGGTWSQRPPKRNTQWRLTNLEHTIGKWGLTEVELFEDELCTFPLRGYPISLGQENPLSAGENNAFDTNLSSWWIANCSKIPGSISHLTHGIGGVFHGCEPEQAWIGLDFSDSEKVVRCVRFYQKAPQDLSDEEQRRSWSRGVGLQKWTGNGWKMVERYWDRPHWDRVSNVTDPALEPTVATPYLGNAPGRYEDTRPPDRAVWKIINDDYTKGNWRVIELEFYTEAHCLGGMLEGKALSMQGPSNFLSASNAFDLDERTDLFWESACSRGPGNTCLPLEAWIGLYTRGQQPMVKCFRLLQSRHQNQQSTAVQLHVYKGGEWIMDSLHRDVGGGTWNRRPAEPWTLWRFRNDLPIPGQWRVYELRAYKDPLCLLDMTPGNPVASGFLQFNQGPEKANDLRATTYWGADCRSCTVNATRKYWIGVELPHDAVEAKHEQLMIRCFKMWQSENLDEQVQSMQFQLWNGKDYVLSTLSKTGSFGYLGGGAWSRPSASFMTRWRISPTIAEDKYWRLTELEFYSDSLCTQRLPRTGEGYGGATPVSSGYKPLKSGFERLEYGRLWSEVDLGTDNDTDIKSGLLMEHRPSQSLPAYFGVDYLSLSTWVRCVRFQQGPLPVDQVPSAKLQIWEGANWKDSDPEMLELEMRLDGLGGGGWQRRPAAAGSLWRLENGVRVEEGWAVYETKLFTHPECKNESLMIGEPIASGYAPDNRVDKRPAMAFDGNTATAWVAQCGLVEEQDRPPGFEQHEFLVGCNESQAWIGLDLGASTAVEQVKCVRIYQVGYRPMQSSSVKVSKWTGAVWRYQWSLDSLGGSAWDQRPAAPNSMWRLQHFADQVEPCEGQLRRVDKRAWGISDFKFFKDEACTEQVDGGSAISSGSVENFIPSITDQSSYELARSVDQDQVTENSQLTTWAANCLLGWMGTDTSKTNCSREWIGMAYSNRAVEVRCVTYVQSRHESSKCCDPASEIQLQRWNGSKWVEATWQRTPPQPAIATATNIRPVVDLGAHFLQTGPCPDRRSTRAMYEEIIEEKRNRRDSESCVVKLTGAVTLLADPFCIKHPRCVEMISNEGNCCPIGDLVQSASRCCCDFFLDEKIYDDEEEPGDARQAFAFELATVWMSNQLPWPGLVATIALYIATLFFPPNAETKVAAWVRERMPAMTRGQRVRLRWRQFIATLLWPLLVWRTFLATSKTELATRIKWFILPNDQRPPPMQYWRSAFFLVCGVAFAGMVPWLLIGVLFGEIMIRLALGLCYIIKLFKSPFDPLDVRDMHLRSYLSRTRVKQEGDTASALDIVGGLVSTFVFGLGYFMKFLFDVLVVRSQMLTFGIIDNIEADRVIDIFPALLDVLREPGMLMYNAMYYSSQLVSFILSKAIGIPLCQGSCALVGSVVMVMILYGASQWLNYDLFGLFTSARQMVKATRPECQRVFAQAMILMCMAISFGAIQVTMILFTRALSFANPFQEASWVCPYDDRIALYIGRTMLSGTSLLGLVFVFLCVNGHFFGQDYITARVAHFLEIDLDALDPDGAGDGGGWFRFGVFGAALPTLFGLWFDPWNVDAFLVKERAHIYAMEFRDPQPCQTCGKVHVSYDFMMTATGRTISAACQIVPYGTIVAKASEYLNDPPLYYRGDKLPCQRFTKVPHVEVRGMKNPVRFALLATAETLARFIEYMIPLLRRAISIASYAFVLLGTFTLTEENLTTQGPYVITAGFYLALFRGSCFELLPSIFSYLLGLCYACLADLEGEQVKAHDRVPRTITGQMLSGATAAAVLANSFVSAGWGIEGESFIPALLVGWFGGYLFSLGTLAVNAYFEDFDPGPDDPPRNTMGQILIKVAYAVISGSVIGLVAIDAGYAGISLPDSADIHSVHLYRGDRVSLRGSIGLVLALVAAQIVTLRVVLLENIPWSEPDGPRPVYNWRDSPAQVVLRLQTLQFFPGFVGIPVSTFLGLTVGNFAKDAGFSPTVRAFVTVIAAICSANICALTVHKLMEKPPQLIAFGVGIMLMVPLYSWNVIFGGIVAVMVGTMIGSILEERVLRLAVEYEKTRREALAENDAEYFDQHRAEMQQNWDKEDLPEVVPEPPPEPLTREAKLQEILNVAAYNNYLDEMEYRETEAAVDLRPLEFEPYDDNVADESMQYQTHGDDLLDQHVHALEMSGNAPLHALPEEAPEHEIPKDASADLQLAVLQSASEQLDALAAGDDISPAEPARPSEEQQLVPVLRLSASSSDVLTTSLVAATMAPGLRNIASATSSGAAPSSRGPPEVDLGDGFDFFRPEIPDLGESEEEDEEMATASSAQHSKQSKGRPDGVNPALAAVDPALNPGLHRPPKRTLHEKAKGLQPPATPSLRLMRNRTDAAALAIQARQGKRKSPARGRETGRGGGK